MKTIYSILFMVLLSAGAAHAVPAKISDRTEYSVSLNSIASVIMTWYGSLITASDMDDQFIQFQGDTTYQSWNDYRSQYPKKITQIVITGTQLLKQGSQYFFTVNSNISFSLQDKKHSRSYKELFIFDASILENITNLSSLIKDIRLENSEDITTSARTGYNRKHYRVREFIYAWLSHLDGVETLDPVMNAKAWMDSAVYALEIGADKFRGSVSGALNERKEVLAKGGHLLRSMEVGDIQKDNTFTIALILEWKGKNIEGTPVIAKIKQVLKIQIKPDKTWEVLTVNEKHLLPIVAPWMGLLC